MLQPTLPSLLVLVVMLVVVDSCHAILPPGLHANGLAAAIQARPLEAAKRSSSNANYPSNPTFGSMAMPIDHENYDRTHAMFTMRYLWDSTFFAGDGAPVFLMVGAEAPLAAEQLAPNTTIYEYARRFSGLMISNEHRYYGESTPFGSGNLTTNNLKYLSAQQVMLDLMLMREQAIRQFKCPNSPWILMGGSWPGALAAWTRVKYPHLYVGAIAEAAPVNITLSSPQWNQVVASVMGPACVERVVEMFGVLGDMIQTPSGFAELTQTFSFLSTAPTVYPYDSSPGNMMYTLTTLVWGAAETNFGTPAVYPWKFPMQYMCTKLLEPRSINDTIAQFVTLAKQYTAWANLIGSNNMLPTYRLFNYQRCTQIPIWNGYDADSRLFYPGPLIGPELLLANCKIDFGGGLIPNAHKTNLRFAGGRKPQFARTAGNIAFINDLWDPTHSLTPMRDLSSSVKAINLPNMAHGGFLVGLILYPNPADRPPEFEQAIDTVGGLISSWIAEYHEQSRWLAEEQQ